MPEAEPGTDKLPNPADIQTALDRIVSSPGFKKSPQLACFLSFVVGETLAGRGDRIKAYNIAADALGRSPDFDPQNDPIVRVEAGRLRRALDHYYSNGGTGDPVVIELPRGHYVPKFRCNKGRLRAASRLRAWRGRIAGLLRNNIRLIAMIAVIAAIVSLSVEFIAALLAK